MVLVSQHLPIPLPDTLNTQSLAEQ